MTYRLTTYVEVPELIIFQRCDKDKARKIELLEFVNFELRNQIVRLTLHNATLRKMLKDPAFGRERAHGYASAGGDQETAEEIAVRAQSAVDGEHVAEPRPLFRKN